LIDAEVDSKLVEGGPARIVQAIEDAESSAELNKKNSAEITQHCLTCLHLFFRSLFFLHPGPRSTNRSYLRAMRSSLFRLILMSGSVANVPEDPPNFLAHFSGSAYP